MSTPRPLNKAPIREAIFDFGFPRVAGSDGATFEQFKGRLQSKFPAASPILILEGQLRFGQGGPEIKPSTTRLVNGWTFNGTEEAVQFRLDGFSYHRLQPYTSWENTIEEFRKYWEMYRNVVAVERIFKIGVRYINSFALRWDPVDWSENLSAPPAPCLNDPNAKQFLSRCFYKNDATGLQSTILQSLDRKGDVASIVLDINLALTFSEGKFSDDPEIWSYLNSMRAVKNKHFFDLLQEPLIGRFA